MKTTFTLLLCLAFCFTSHVLAAKSKSKSRRLVQLDVEVVRVNDDHAYVCNDGWTYLTHKDHTINKDQVCTQTAKCGNYRLLGGASITGFYRQCTPQESDARNLAKAICVKTGFDQLPEVVDGPCPDDSARVSLAEVTDNKDNFCALLEEDEAARVGFGGVFLKAGGACFLSDWDQTAITKNLCVKRHLADIKIVDSGEDICKEGQSLVTLKEALENRDEYCEALPHDKVVRLSGGASFDGKLLGCKIHEADDRQLKHALCGDATRDTF